MRIFNKMKKTMLVMAASLFCVGAAFAEVKTGSYAVVADDIASGAQITSVEGITMTYGTSETWTSGSGKVTVGDQTFEVYASTGENCSPTNGAVPTAGPYVVFAPKYDGTITGIVSNAGNNKKGYIVKNEDNNLVNGTVLIDGAEVAWESGTPYNSEAKYNGGVTFEVEAGATYYFYMAGSKMRFNGFIYSYEEVADAPAVEGTPLTADMFKAWDSPTAPTTSSAIGCSFVLNEPTGLPYGDGNVGYLNYADLSEYSKLIVTVSAGTPRFCFNRLTADGQDTQDGVDSKLLDIPGKPWGAEKYQTVDGNVYTIDLEKIVADYGYARLNCIKGANWADVTVTSMVLVKAEEPEQPVEPEQPEQPEEPTGEVIFSANFDGEGAQPLGGWGNNSTREVVDGAMKVTNPSVVNPWEVQLAQDFATPFEVGLTYTLKFKVKGSTEGSISVGFQIVDGYQSAGEFGAAKFTTEWQDVELKCTCSAGGGTRLIFSLGDYAGDIYLDDFELSYEGVLAPKEWVSVIANGDFEGTGAKYFVAKENGGANAGAFLAPAITDGIGKDGSRGITMKSYAGAAEEWDAQFWIVAAEGLPAGTEFRVSFDYRASAAVQIATQAHGEPGGYQHWDAIGAPSFTTEWQHYEKSGIVSADMAGANGFKSIAFNLSKDKANDVEFFFDNITFEAVGVAPITPAAKVAYLCGATETTEAIYTALVNAGLDVTPLNYDAVSLTEAEVNELAAYDLVVLAGGTGSGTNLAKTANLLLGKVNVLSTKSFWYKHYGTNGGNPGTADNPSLNLVKLVAEHPIFAGIAGDEFAAFVEHADERTTGRYLQSNGSFANGPEQVALAQTNGANCIGEAWVDGKGYIIIPVDGAQPAGYLTADGEALFANVAKYLIAGEQYNASRFDLTAYEAAVAAAEAFKATLNPEDETEAMGIEAVNETLISAADWLAEVEADPEATQDDVNFIAEDLNNIIEKFKAQLETEKLMTKVREAEAAGQALLEKYPNYTDEAGLVIALRNLPRFAMGMTAEQIQAAIDAVYAAIPLFEAENAPLASGNYYLKNVASGKYLVGGNSWGTFATLGDHAEDVALAVLEDGKYTIDTRLSNGGESHYLGGAGWMDGAATGWTFAKQAKGIYALTVDGVNYLGWDGANSAAAVALTDPTSPNAQWQVITKDELVAGLAAATAVQPVDATFFIQDPNFGRNNTRVSAWVGDPVKGGDVTNFCAEKWNTNFDIYQDLTGLVNGYYKVTVQGYYRAGNGGATGMEQNAYLYAGDKSTALMNINAEAGNAVFQGGNVSDVAGMGIVPNDMTTASKAFTAGLYADNSITVQVTDGTLRIGVKKETLIDADWTIFDNFELTYYGTEEPPMVAPGAYYMKNIGAGKYLVAANSWGTQASFGDHGLDVQVAFANGKYTIDSKVSNGGDNHFLGTNGYVDSPAAEWTLVEQGDGIFAITADGTNFIGYDGSSSVMSITLTDAASANAQWQFVTKDELLKSLSAASMMNPVDATFFIQGQNFGRNDGRNTAWQGAPAIGGDNANMNAEKWNCNFDVYQDLAGLPNGFYKVSAQGYYRAGNGGATSMEQNAYLYAGEASTPLMNINAHAGNAIFNGGNVSDVPGMGIVPNNMATASTAFSAGLYADNSVFAQVTDGTLRIGIKKDVLIGADWTIFDNFELAYYGAEDPVPMITAVDSLNKLIAEAVAWKAELNAEDEMHAMVLGTLDMMIPAAQAVADAPASVDQVNGMIFDVYSMLGTYKPMIEKYDAAMAATAAAEEALALYGSFNNPSDDAGFAAAIASVQEGVALLNDWFEPITIDELNARVASMRVAQKAFIYENPKAPTATISAIQGANRVVALSHELEGLTIYYKTSEAADYMIYTAPFHVSTATTVWAYAEYVSPEAKAYASEVADYQIVSEIVKLNAPTIEVEGIAAETEDALTTDIFKTWDGVGADAQPTADAVYPEIHVGEELGAGAMVYGLSTVYYLSYADLTGYNKIVFEGTPGVQLRVLMNRVENEGALVEVNPTIGEDGKAEVDLTGMEYVHLNAIKTGWGSPASTITKVALVAEGEPVAFNCVVTSDQSAIINQYGITPKETITYDFFPWNEDKGECAKVPSISGIVTSGESINGLSAGLLIVKVAAYGFESATTVKYLGAAEDWAGGDAFVTGIDEVNAKEVKAVKFYTVSGVEIEEPTTGLYIKRVLYSDGTVKTSTIMGK